MKGDTDMKKAEKVIETLCVICTVVFLLAVAVMVLGQAVSIIMLNGELSGQLSAWIAKPASVVAAVATVLAMILAYMRGQMSS